MSLHRSISTSLPLALALLSFLTAESVAGDFSFRLRSRVEVEPGKGNYTVVEKSETWAPGKTALIVCDMWDAHHCLNAVRRGAELAPCMDKVLAEARKSGATIVHAPSSCMAAYKDHPARKRAQAVPKSKTLPPQIADWCYKIPSEEKGTYPIDQTDGGEDDDPAEHAAWAKELAGRGLNPREPWKSQMKEITIDPTVDYVSDSGEEIWSLLEAKGIDNVILMGVHTNMCVLGRPFGLRQLAKNGKHVVLMRDMTDTMYNPQRPPRVSHFAGTELIIEHVEKYVCPTITSDQLLGGTPYRFSTDPRPEVVFIMADDEYKTEVTLPQFASAELVKREFHVEYAFALDSDKNSIPGLSLLKDADVAVIAARRRLPTAGQLAELRKFVADGKGIVGIRTASHAFSARGNAKPPEGHAAWPEFDAHVLGGHYTGHHPEGPTTSVAVAPEAKSHPILKGIEASKLIGHGSLYKVSPLASSTSPILLGTIPSQPTEPLAWTNEPATGGRVFYSSLGHPEDFKNPEFVKLLANAVEWASKK